MTNTDYHENFLGIGEFPAGKEISDRLKTEEDRKIERFLEFRSYLNRLYREVVKEGDYENLEPRPKGKNYTGIEDARFVMILAPRGPLFSGIERKSEMHIPRNGLCLRLDGHLDSDDDCYRFLLSYANEYKMRHGSYMTGRMVVQFNNFVEPLDEIIRDMFAEGNPKDAVRTLAEVANKYVGEIKDNLRKSNSQKTDA